MNRRVDSRAEWDGLVQSDHLEDASLKFVRYPDPERGWSLCMSVYVGISPVPVYDLRGDWVRDLADEMRRRELRDRDARDIEAAWSICRELAGDRTLLMSTDGHLAVLRGIQHGRDDP